jgi:glycosyltransferase involved in cell wall biosynthesis
MKKLRILVVNDSSSAAFIFQKYFPWEVGAIYFTENDVISPVKNPMFFVKGGISSQIEQIKRLAKEFDLFFCFGWPAAAICYLAGVKYVMYFVDAYIDKETRIRKKIPTLKKYFLLSLYDDALYNAAETVGALPHDTAILRKYRHESEIIFQLIDADMFNTNVEKLELKKEKFTFFSPQRIEPDKGQLILWKAIKKTKSDFVVLQTDWGQGEYYEEAIKSKPSKVQIIPKVKRENMAKYLRSVDALLGQISKTSCGSTEREAALCGTPVFCYAPYSFSDNDPFYKGDKDPERIAEIIDRIVTDDNYRLKLADMQSKWVRDTFDNQKSIAKWECVFERAIQRSTPKPKLRYKLIIFCITAIERVLRRDFSAFGRRAN